MHGESRGDVDEEFVEELARDVRLAEVDHLERASEVGASGSAALDASAEIKFLPVRDDAGVPDAVELLSEELRRHDPRHTLRQIVQVELNARGRTLAHHRARRVRRPDLDRRAGLREAPFGTGTPLWPKPLCFIRPTVSDGSRTETFENPRGGRAPPSDKHTSRRRARPGTRPRTFPSHAFARSPRRRSRTRVRSPSSTRRISLGEAKASTAPFPARESV